MRFLERKREFEKALLRLEEGIKECEDSLQRDGVIQRFEFTFELAWKTIKDYLEYQGYTERLGSPREIIQMGFKQGILEDGEAWIKMMLARNSLSHMYDEENAKKIYIEIKEEYLKLLQKLKEKLAEI